MWKNYKNFMKEIKEDINKWGVSIPCLFIGRLNVSEMSVLHNLIFRFNVIPIKL